MDSPSEFKHFNLVFSLLANATAGGNTDKKKDNADVTLRDVNTLSRLRLRSGFHSYASSPRGNSDEHHAGQKAAERVVSVLTLLGGESSAFSVIGKRRRQKAAKRGRTV